MCPAPISMFSCNRCALSRCHPPQCLRAPTAILYQYNSHTHTHTHTHTVSAMVLRGATPRPPSYACMCASMYACIPGRLPCWPDRMRETEQSGAPEATRGGEEEGGGAGAKATGRGIKTCQGTPGRRGCFLCVCLLRETDRQSEGPSLALFPKRPSKCFSLGVSLPLI
jgi:hypothetical protein